MIIYNKLVRDRIPQIIEASGKTCKVEILDDTAYEYALRAKLVEELNEVQAAKTDEELIEELADLYEVLNALVVSKGYTEEQFLSIVKKKSDKRGGFRDKIYLVGVRE